jgi:hypothetical protein
MAGFEKAELLLFTESLLDTNGHDDGSRDGLLDTADAKMEG